MSWVALLPLVALTAHTIVNAALLRRPARDATTAERVAVLLPLRNEAARLTPCLTALLTQRGVPHLRIVILDDGSTDDTQDSVRVTAPHLTLSPTPAPMRSLPAPLPGRPPGVARAGAADPPPPVWLIDGGHEPPPAGWLGKPWACQRLADAVPDADVLVFLDADVVLEPDAIAAAVAARRTELLSPYPRITGAGQLVQPLLQWSWLTFLPLRAMERSPRPSLAAAGGQWLVITRDGYDRAGGHAAVRGDILEDVALARAVKRSGGRIALADGSRLATCRMYPTFHEMSEGYAKSLWASFGSPAGAAAVVVMLLLLYASPPVLLLLGAWPQALAAYGLGVLGRVVSALATGGRWWHAFAHPASVVTFAYLVARSFRLRRQNRLTWRGRPV